MSFREQRSTRLRRIFLDAFSAMDIADPLVSFDEDAAAPAVSDSMTEKGFDLVGVRQDGLVNGYVRHEDLVTGACRDHMRPFTPEDDLVPDTASLTDVVKSLATDEQCFVTILDRVGAIVTLSDLEKPPMRMFLFGMLTMHEMVMTEMILDRHGDDSWQKLISPQRLEKAVQIQQERARRGPIVRLIDCLQYGDKGYILSYDKEIRNLLGQGSRNEARKAVKEMETLRNNLAHSQEIIPTSWARIVIACSRLEHNIETLTARMSSWGQPKVQQTNVIEKEATTPE